MRAFGTTIFAEMSALAVRTGAVNLGQGFPDTDGPPEMLEAAAEALRTGRNQYPPGPGIPELREAVARTSSASGASSTTPTARCWSPPGPPRRSRPACSALCEPGDEVVCFEPYYDSYAAAWPSPRPRLKTVTLRPDGARYGFDPDELRDAFSRHPGCAASSAAPPGASEIRGHLSKPSTRKAVLHVTYEHHPQVGSSTCDRMSRRVGQPRFSFFLSSLSCLHRLYLARRATPFPKMRTRTRSWC